MYIKYNFTVILHLQYMIHILFPMVNVLYLLLLLLLVLLFYGYLLGNWDYIWMYALPARLDKACVPLRTEWKHLLDHITGWGSGAVFTNADRSGGVYTVWIAIRITLLFYSVSPTFAALQF